jgi:hypothetical protein
LFFCGGNQVLNSFFWCPIKSPSPLVKKRRRKKRGLFVDFTKQVSDSLKKKKKEKKEKAKSPFP